MRTTRTRTLQSLYPNVLESVEYFGMGFAIAWLTSFRSVLQFRPLVWRNTHPYVLVDRHEDITHPNLTDKDPTCDRSVVCYGYVRGSHLKAGQKVHLIGVGDFNMAEIETLPDPCPIPDKEQKVCARIGEDICVL